MPAIKVTLFFEISTVPAGTAGRRRIGGWSESWYYTGSSPPVGALFAPRAALLPTSGSLVGYRTQQVDPSTRGQDFALDIPGGSFVTDLPSMCLQFKSPTGFENNRKWSLRGVPDLNVKGGEYNPEPAWAALLTAYEGAVRTNDFRGRGRDLTKPLVNIISITTASGVTIITTDASGGWNVDDFIQVNRSKDQYGNAYSARMKILDLDPTRTVVTVGNVWQRPNTGGGTAFQSTFVYPNLLAFGPPKAGNRKVGRPSGGFRGRQTSHR